VCLMTTAAGMENSRASCSAASMSTMFVVESSFPCSCWALPAVGSSGSVVSA